MFLKPLFAFSFSMVFSRSSDSSFVIGDSTGFRVFGISLAASVSVPSSTRIFAFLMSVLVVMVFWAYITADGKGFANFLYSL